MAANTYKVTTTATSGTGSLEAALTDAAAGDNIQFTVGGQFTLDQSYALNGAITFDLDGNNDTVGGGALTDPAGGQGSLTLVDSAPSGGPHTLTLTAAESYTGATTINVGTLALGTGGSVAGSSVVNVASGATFDVSFGEYGQSTSVEALSGAGTVATTSPSTMMMMSGKGSTAVSLTGDGTTTFNGTITGSGSLIENSAAGTGVQILSGTSSYTGGTTFESGTLSVSTDANLGNASGGLTFAGGTLEITGYNFNSARNASLNGTGTVQVDGAAQLNGVLADSTALGAAAGALRKTGAGTLILTNAETYTGTTTIAAGTLELAYKDSTNTNGSLGGAIVDDGTLRLQQGSNNYGSGASFVVANDISGSGGLVAAAGEDQYDNSNVVTLSGANTYTGATLVEYGTLQGGVRNAFGTNSAVTVTGASGGFAILDLGGFDQAIGSLAGGAAWDTTNGFVTNNGGQAATLTIGGDNTSTEFDGSIQDGGYPVALNKVGTGTLTLGIGIASEYSYFDEDNTNTYSGTTTVSAGTLDLATDAAISANTTFAFAAPGATLEFDEAPAASQTTGNATLANAISAFGPGDRLDLRDLAFGGGSATLDGSTLRVVSGGVEQDFTLSNPGTTLFATSSDGPANGTLVTAYALPTISGTVANQTTAGTSPVSPFSAATVADPNAGTDTLTIALSGGAGALKDGAGFAGPSTLQQTGASTYQLTGTAAAVTAELRALSFAPAGSGAAGSSATTTFTLKDASDAAAAAVASDATTTVVDAIPSAPTPAPPPAPGNPAPAPAAPTPTPDAVSLSSQVAYGRGAFTLYGTASSAAGVGKVEITATRANGRVVDLGAAAVKPDGTFAFTDRIGPTYQGFVTATLTDGAGGTAAAAADYSLTGGLDQDGFKARQTTYSADGTAELSESLFTPDGHRTVDVMASGQSYGSTFFDTFENGYKADNTFTFDPGHGLDVVDQFRLRGDAHDTLSFKGSDFGNDVGQVLRRSVDAADGSGVVIHDPASKDTVELLGISKGQLARNAGVIAFHA